jgi:hypothetical protein
MHPNLIDSENNSKCVMGYGKPNTVYPNGGPHLLRPAINQNRDGPNFLS